MCNCGKKRNALIHQKATVNNTATTRHNFIQQILTQQNVNKQTVMFQYTGGTALTVRGNTTGKSYRFSFPEDIQHIAFDDAAALLNISILKKIN